MGTRLLLGLVGQATEYTLGKVTLTGNAAADHASLVTIAAEALGVHVGVPTPTNLGAVRMRQPLGRGGGSRLGVRPILRACGAQIEIEGLWSACPDF